MFVSLAQLLHEDVGFHESREHGHSHALVYNYVKWFWPKRVLSTELLEDFQFFLYSGSQDT